MHIAASILALGTVFLFAVSKFSKQIQTIFGKRLRSVLVSTTNTPMRGILTGAFVTAIVQSSTAVSVLMVTLTSAHVIPLSGALAVIIGANIGTTLTLQLIAFKILALAPYILILGFLISKTNYQWSTYGKPLFYFGLIFSCLYLISVIAGTLQSSPMVTSLVSHVSGMFVGVLYGFVIVNVLQSSTLASSVIIIFASQGILSLEQSIWLLYGANIGTTTTALIASLVTDKNGKRVAVGHTLFNIVTVLLLLPFTSLLLDLLQFISSDIVVQVANAHLFINFFGACIFYIGFTHFEAVVRKIVR